MQAGLSSLYLGRLVGVLLVTGCFFVSGFGQHGSDEPAVVRPGAPGQPTQILPASTKAKLPPSGRKDVEFMQGMIIHHAQAVEMVGLIESRSQNEAIRLLGSKIGNSQADEMKFMKRWLEVRGMPIEMQATGGHNQHGSQARPHLMLGMLSPEQMEALRNAKGAEFDRLFLKGMIQHHEGAIAMVGELFATSGAGQDAELFNFATDVDSGQRAEINTMKTLLGEKP